MIEAVTMTNLVAEILPRVEPKKRLNLLFNCTAHPCASESTTKEQLLRLAKETDGTYQGCVAWLQKEHEAEMESFMLDCEEKDL